MPKQQVLTGLPLLALIQVETNMSLEELIRLEWRDVDMASGDIVIPPSAEYPRGSRRVRLSNCAYRHLLAVLMCPVPLPLSPLVFPDSRAGKAYRPSTVNSWFQANGCGAATSRREWARGMATETPIDEIIHARLLRQ